MSAYNDANRFIGYRFRTFSELITLLNYWPVLWSLRLYYTPKHTHCVPLIWAIEFLLVTGFAALLFRGASSANSQKDCSGGQNFPSLQLIKLVSVRYIYHSFPYSATMYIKIFRLLMVANLATISQSMVLCKENCKSGRVGENWNLYLETQRRFSST